MTLELQQQSQALVRAGQTSLNICNLLQQNIFNQQRHGRTEFPTCKKPGSLAVTLNDHPTNLKQTIIKNSFYCGLLTFTVNFLLVLSKAMSALLIFSNILPGLVYAIILCDFANNMLDFKRFLFILFSGGLYVFVAWIAIGYSFFGDNTKLCFPIASVMGATLLLTLYYFLIDKDIFFFKGLLLVSGIGLLSSILPFLGNRLEQQINDYDIKGNVNLGFTLLIFPVWQTLFGWTIHKVKKATASRVTQGSFTPTSSQNRT